MKGAGKTILAMFLVSVFMVAYVHQQIALLHISYEIDSRTDKVTHLSEEYRRLKFEVEQLKAPRLLDEKLKTLSLDLALPEEIRVVKMPAPQMEKALETISVAPATGRVFDFLGRWVDVAQAKTDDQQSS